MSKLNKLVKHPRLFFVDMAKKRMPKYKQEYIKRNQERLRKQRNQQSEEQSYKASNDLPLWFKPTAGDRFRNDMTAGKPVFLYIPWIESHTNILMDKLNNSTEYNIVALDIFEGIHNDGVRRNISRYIRENPHIYRKLLASRIVPVSSQIKGILFSFDWAPVNRVCANLCEELEIPRILIPHESVFASREKYYTDVTAGASVPVADVILGWGNLQKEIFVERGYPESRFIAVGAPKFDSYKNYRAILSREKFARLFGLDPTKKIILFAAQPLDSQFSADEARESQRQVIADLVDYCCSRNAQLIVRTPPSKDKILNIALTEQIQTSGCAAIDDAICYITTPEEAIFHADVVTSINSTMLFEASLIGKPSLSTKYLDFQQIWQEAEIPVATNKTELTAELNKMLASKIGGLSQKGLKWAESAFTSNGFDGKATNRIIKYLEQVATGQTKINMRPRPVERALFATEDDSHINVIGTHSVTEVCNGSQKYLLNMLSADKRQTARNGMKEITKLAAVDLFVKWGIKPTEVKKKLAEVCKIMGREYLYVEDGFIRSIDIGLTGTPGLSIILDDKTAYYDATKPSRLQMLLQDGAELTSEQKIRAAAAIKKIVSNRVSKYNHAPDTKLQIGDAERKKILLVDQRYEDQSVESGLADNDSFQKMLADAVERSDEYDIIIKRHPDAIKGGKSGYFNTETLEKYKAVQNIYFIDYDINPYALLDIADEIFVVTSGMGFEALMAGKKVHCYGVPFYAGWGLTNDYKTLPTRTRKRSVEDIFHYAYIVLSRYYSPKLERKCSVEELVDYIIENRC